jgi:serine/threonine protein kinase
MLFVRNEAWLAQSSRLLHRQVTQRITNSLTNINRVEWELVMSMSVRRLGKYELREHLGRGQAGEVWKAYDHQLRREVAIKILHSDFQADPQFFTRFTQEGATLTSLHHPNIVRVREVALSRPSATESNVTAYIAMEYVDGQTLADYLNATSRKGIFPTPDEIVYLFTSLGIAIDYAHQKGVVHGNIRPENILLDQSNTTQFPAGEPMLTDFALDRLVGENATITSPLYMSPEQAQGNGANPRSDIYAMGVILYELCTGVQPFRDESSVAVMMQHMNTLPTPPSLINTTIPSALSEVILRAMAKDTAARFAMGSLLAAAVADAFAIHSTVTLSPQQLAAISEEAEQEYKTTSRPRIPILGVAQPQPRLPSRPLPAPQSPQPSQAPQMLPAATTQQQTTDTPKTLPQVQPLPAAQTQQMSPVAPAPEAAPITKKIPVTPDIAQQPTIAAPAQKLPPPPPMPAQAPAPAQLSPALAQRASAAYAPPAPPSPPWNAQRPPAARRIAGMPLYIAIPLLLLLIVGVALSFNLLFNGHQPAPGTIVGHVFFQDDPLGHDDVLRVELLHIAQPPAGQSDVVWLQTTTHNTIPLGTLTFQNGIGTLLYTSNTQHINLLSILHQVLVTQQSGSAAPTGMVLYTASPDANAFLYIKNILYATPGLSDKSSVVADVFNAIKSMNDKAASIVDSLQGTHDYGLATRQATRIIELLDGTKYAQQSGDLPAKDAPQLFTSVGLLSSPTTTGYLATLDQQLTLLQQHAGNNPDLLQHIQHVRNAVVDLQSWLQKIHQCDVQLLKAANLTDPTTVSTALQLRQLAADSYTGRTIPPNEGPLPIQGSAGAYQAYVEAQYMATLNLVQA